MRFDLITLFPEMFTVVSDLGVTGRAHKRNLWSLHTCNPRQFTEDVHQTVDDRPYGGGPGMVMMAEPLAQAVEFVRNQRVEANVDINPAPVILLSPVGEVLNQGLSEQISLSSGAILICGRYEGIDQRFIDTYVDLQVSLGDYVLSGGELGAMVLIDSVVRLLPGVLHDAQSAIQDSFSKEIGGILDCPHYTRPENWRDITVPSVLLSGNHAEISKWRKQKSLEITTQVRPDLLLNKS